MNTYSVNYRFSADVITSHSDGHKYWVQKSRGKEQSDLTTVLQGRMNEMKWMAIKAYLRQRTVLRCVSGYSSVLHEKNLSFPPFHIPKVE